MKNIIATLVLALTTGASANPESEDYSVFTKFTKAEIIRDTRNQPALEPPTVAYSQGEQKESMEPFELPPAGSPEREAAVVKINEWLHEGHKFITSKEFLNHPDKSATLVVFYIEAISVQVVEGQNVPATPSVQIAEALSLQDMEKILLGIVAVLSATAFFILGRLSKRQSRLA